MSKGETLGQPDGAAVWRILDVARRLAVPCDLNELLELIVDAARQVLTADRGSIFLYDGATEQLYTTVATGARQIRFGIDQGIAGACARERRIINVPNCYEDARFNPQIDRQTGYRTRCLLAVPLIGLDDELVGVTQLLNPVKGHFDDYDNRIAEALASQAAVAIQRAHLMEERLVKVKWEHDLELARQIQMNVLPKELPSCAGYDLVTFSQPADQTGGDIYDLIRLQPAKAGDRPDTAPLLLLLADASGHGIGPALSVTQVRAMLRIGIRFSQRLGELLTHINSQLTRDLASEHFITAFLGILDPLAHRLHYHAPGQGPLLHYQAATGKCALHHASTVPLGIVEDLSFGTPAVIDLAPNDLFVLLTDGFYECQNADQQQFGHERMSRLVAGSAGGSAQQILQVLLDAMQRFVAGQPQADDQTAIVIKRVDSGSK